jgi:hypothetical protein
MFLCGQLGGTHFTEATQLLNVNSCQDSQSLGTSFFNLESQLRQDSRHRPGFNSWTDYLASNIFLEELPYKTKQNKTKQNKEQNSLTLGMLSYKPLRNTSLELKWQTM